MGLYDNYKVHNSNYISTFAGSIVPEMAQFATTMKGRYDEAQESDDVLYEALGNMSHLSDEADVTYANELKDEYAGKLAERVKRGDYENMGRRTRRDAKAFVNEYRPLASRLQAFQQISQRVMDDDKIISPETKNQILGYIRYTNQTPKNADGTLVRNADGRVALGAIQDWAYAKDVDIDKKLIEVLKEVETEVKQSGFTPNGSGLLVSATGETRTKEDMARMAMQRMQTDPEISAMIKRDALLRTYAIPGADAIVQAGARNVSAYEEYKAAKLTDAQIKQVADRQGLTVEDLKVKPYDAIKKVYAEKGLSEEQAAKNYIRDLAERDLRAPHADLVSSILKVDKQTLDAKADPEFEAKLKAMYDRKLVDYQNSIENAEMVSQSIDQSDEATTSYIDLFNANTKAADDYENAKITTRSALGNLLGQTLSGRDRPDSQKVREWTNEMESILNRPERQTAILNQTTDAAKKNELQALFNQYKKIKTSALEATQSLKAIPASVSEDAKNSAWLAYQNTRRSSLSSELKNDKGKPFANKEELAAFIQKKYLSGGQLHSKTFGGYGNQESLPLVSFNPAVNAYIESMNEGTKIHRGRIKDNYSVYEPTGNGYVKQMTDMVTTMAKGAPANFRTEGGGNLMQMIADTKGDMSATEMNRYMNDMRVRIIGELSKNGETQALVTLPNGSTKKFIVQGISSTKANEMNMRMLHSSSGAYTKPEADNKVAQAVVSAGLLELQYTDEIILGNARKNETIDLNDQFAFKIITSGKGSPNGSKTAGQLLINNGNGQYTSAGKSTDNITLETLFQLLGRDKFREISTGK